MGGTYRRITRVHHHEAAGAIGALYAARYKAGLAYQSGLLVSGHGGDGYACAEQSRIGVAEFSGVIQHFRQQAGRDVQQLQQLRIPLLGVNIEQHGSGGVAGIGAVHLATGQPPQQKAVHRAKAQLTSLCTLACTLDIVQQPAQLGGGKVRVDEQAGALVDQLLVAVGLQLVAKGAGASVLPDDGGVDRLTGYCIPYQGGFPLIGYADGTDIAGGQPALFQRFAHDADDTLPDVLGIMFDPAIVGKMLGELLLRHTDSLALGVEHHGPAACRTLVYGEKVNGHGLAPGHAIMRSSGAADAGEAGADLAGQVGGCQRNFQAATTGADIHL